MRVFRRMIPALLAAMIAISACGCWDYNDPEDLTYMLGMAFDRAPDGRIHATLETAASSGESKPKPEYIEVDGNTFIDAQSNANKMSNAPLNWSHVEIVIVSRDIAENDMDGLLDMLVRLTVVRDTLVIFVSKEATAREVIMAANPSGGMNSRDIIGALRAERNLEKAPYIKLFQFADAMADYMQSAALPAIGLDHSGRSGAIEMSGMAVFSDGRLKGILDENDTQAFMMLEYGQNKYTLPLTAAADGEFSSASVELMLGGVDIRPGFADGTATVDISVSGEIIPVEISGASTDPERFRDILSAINAGAATTLENSVSAMILHTKQFGGCDVLRIGNLLRNRKPEVWREIDERWKDYYGNMTVNVKATLRIHNTGDTIQPISGSRQR